MLYLWLKLYYSNKDTNLSQWKEEIHMGRSRRTQTWSSCVLSLWSQEVSSSQKDAQNIVNQESCLKLQVHYIKMIDWIIGHMIWAQIPAPILYPEVRLISPVSKFHTSNHMAVLSDRANPHPESSCLHKLSRDPPLHYHKLI